MQPTLKKIADLAGVSIGTDHRAIHKNGPVSKENLELIEKIIKRLNYKPNIFAQTLVKGKGLKFGVIMPRQYQDGEYWKLPAYGIDEAKRDLKHFRVSIKVFPYDKFSSDSFKEAGQKALEANLDGLLIAPIQEEAAECFIRKIPKNIPFIFFDSDIPNSPCLSTIHQDSFYGGAVAAKLMSLIVQQAATISIIRFLPNTSHIEQRMEGFQQYLSNRSDLNLIVTNIPEKSTRSDVRKILRELVRCNEDLKGIFVTGAHTYEVADFIASRKLDRKIYLIGFDLVPANVKYLKADVIDFLLSQKPDLQGYTGIQSLYRAVILKEPVDKEIVLPIEIITKENVDFHGTYISGGEPQQDLLNISYELEN